MGAVATAFASLFGEGAAGAVAGSAVEGGIGVSLAGAGSELAAGLTASELGSVGLLGTGTSLAAGAGAAAAGSALLSSPATSSAAGAATTSLLTPKPQIPQVKPTPALPDPLEVQKARQRAITDQLTRRGRASTILTNQTDTLG